MSETTMRFSFENRLQKYFGYAGNTLTCFSFQCFQTLHNLVLQVYRREVRTYIYVLREPTFVHCFSLCKYKYFPI